jgi:superfamily II DNA or RNA helicase
MVLAPQSVVKFRPYQQEAYDAANDAWVHGFNNVLLVEPTGGGKTVIFAKILADHDGASCAIAHRQELVGQISLALARNGVRHRIIGPNKTIRMVVKLHMDELGVSYYDPNSKCAVAGVDTLVRRAKELSGWLKTVTLWVQDEAHHVLKDNKWGKAAAMFPNAKGLGVTATPIRADGKGLGMHADGLFETMIIGPTMRHLIEMGYLTDYRIFAPQSDYVRPDGSSIGSTGDIKPAEAKASVRGSTVIGDIVKHYLKIAPSKLGITFVPGVEIAIDVAKEFNDAGVPAAVVSAKTPDAERNSILRRFKNRELMQLVNVDLFGEGFDLPAIEVVSMARPTESYALFVQQFGRALRLMLEAALMGQWSDYTDGERKAHIAASTKPHAIIIDHVGNVIRHGLPDAYQEWTLDRRERRKKGKPTDVIPVRACPMCTYVYERIYNACPDCGHVAIPMARSGPEFVDGDLMELDSALLAAMRGEADRIVGPVFYPASMPRHACIRLDKVHAERKEMQEALRASLAWWAGYQLSLGRDRSELYKRFFWAFGIDMGKAQTLGTRDALELADRVNIHLGELAA